MQMVVPKEKDGLMLSQLLIQIAGDVPLWAVREAVKKRDVRIDGARISGDVRVQAGQEIRVFWPKSVVSASQQKKKMPLPEIVFEDDRILLINKPQGIASQNEDDLHAGDTALTRVETYLKSAGMETDHLHLCHRLDVQTGGLLLFAKDDEAFESAMKAFSERTFQKFYTCIVKGCPAKREAVMRAHLRKDAQISRVSVTDYPARGSQEIATAYRVIQAGENAKLEVELITGKSHQIRAHLASIGHGIIGDTKYGDESVNKLFRDRYGLKIQLLHAWRVNFPNMEPTFDRLSRKQFTANVPPIMKRVLTGEGLWLPGIQED